ncbi:acyl-CoA thioesterase [Candidatus Sumerlaeota bacterium]|nr:acyl-CoA thioesterase [Candidatus Sumerlaeota bacterium]
MTTTGKPFVHTTRVGYADTDRMGFAHHSRFVVYLEAARIELLRSLGESYREWEDRGILLPVTEVAIQYTKPAYYDDVLGISVRIVELTRIRLKFAYEVRCDAREAILASGTTSHVFMNKDGRPARVGEDVLAKLRG